MPDTFTIESQTPLAANGTFTGVVRNLTPRPSITTFRAAVSTDQAGTLAIQQSVDGITWTNAQSTSEAVTAGATTVVESTVGMPYVRAVLTNGATAQTALSFVTSVVGG